MNKNLRYYLFFITIITVAFLQDPPQGFEYNQGTEQGFYFFLDINIDGQPLEDNDWIGAFKKYDESQNGECTQEEINFDETLGGMCISSNEGFTCTPGYEGCNPENCNEALDVDNDGDTDDSDEYLHKKLGVVAKKVESRIPAFSEMKSTSTPSKFKRM